jgi:hypothetical protein
MILSENRCPLFGIMRLAMLAPLRYGGAGCVTGPALYAKGPDRAEALIASWELMSEQVASELPPSAASVLAIGLMSGTSQDGVDTLEAQAFAYLAVRSLRGLPLTFPGTTRAPRPLTGGVLAKP